MLHSRVAVEMHALKELGYTDMYLSWTQPGIGGFGGGSRSRAKEWCFVAEQPETDELPVIEGFGTTALRALMHAKQQMKTERSLTEPMPEQNTFVCDRCGGTFPCGDEDKAVAKLKKTFPGYSVHECDVVCDECYEIFMSWWNKQEK